MYKKTYKLNKLKLIKLIKLIYMFFYEFKNSYLYFYICLKCYIKNENMLIFYTK